MDQVVHRVKIRRACRVAKAGVRRGNDLGVPPKQIKKGRPRIDVLHAVQEQDWPARAAPYHFQLYSPD